ncbi:MAG TPA: hypothetical protein VGG48_13665 [Rhizomicrobium sp.]
MRSIREAIPAFGRQILGFAMDDAVLTGVETRTPSPARIKRGAEFRKPERHAGQVAGLRPRVIRSPSLCYGHAQKPGRNMMR